MAPRHHDGHIFHMSLQILAFMRIHAKFFVYLVCASCRMEHLGIKVKSMTEEEYCLIPMGGVLPTFPQRTLGIGGTGGMVHPSTGA